MISGSLSLLCSRFFSPFPHGTGSLSVSRKYLALRDGPRWFTLNFSCSALLRCRLEVTADFGYGAFTRSGPPFQKVPLSFITPLLTVLQPPQVRCHTAGLGSCAFARHYLRNHFCFLFLRLLRCFSSPGSLRTSCGDGIASAGLPHSEIRASMGICPSARLIAACHVLLRLREPRHPSCALFSFPFIFSPGCNIADALIQVFGSIVCSVTLSLYLSFASIMSMCSVFCSPWQS